MIWDNRCSYHKAAGDYPPEEDRIHWRVSIKEADMNVVATHAHAGAGRHPRLHGASRAAPGQRPGVLMVHHAHGVTADYKIDAYRLAQLGFNVLAPSLFNMFGIAGTDHIGRARICRPSTATTSSSARWTRPGTT